MADEGRGGRGRVRVEASAKWVRAFFGGVAVADSRRPRLVWEVPSYPAYYFPETDVRTELLTPGGRTERSPSRGEATYYDLRVGGREASDAAWRYHDSPITDLRALVRFEWTAMDAWFEEDEPVIVHPRSPYTRVDILHSSRHVRVEIDGVTVADSRQPRILFETGLPPRYYLPLTDVRMDRLRPSFRVSQCPYKGTATYWSVETELGIAEDVVWTYSAPLPESAKIAGLVCFYNERVDLYVDGERQERPRTPFSR